MSGIMAGIYDTEQQRVIDPINCIAFREAKDSEAPFDLTENGLQGEMEDHSIGSLQLEQVSGIVSVFQYCQLTN